MTIFVQVIANHVNSDGPYRKVVAPILCICEAGNSIAGGYRELHHSGGRDEGIHSWAAARESGSANETPG